MRWNTLSLNISVAGHASTKSIALTPGAIADVVPANVAADNRMNRIAQIHFCGMLMRRSKKYKATLATSSVLVRLE